MNKRANKELYLSETVNDHLETKSARKEEKESVSLNENCSLSNKAIITRTFGGRQCQDGTSMLYSAAISRAVEVDEFDRVPDTLDFILKNYSDTAQNAVSQIVRATHGRRFPLPPTACYPFMRKAP